MSFDPKAFKFEIFTNAPSASNFRAVFDHIRWNHDKAQESIRAEHPSYCDERGFEGIHGDELVYSYFHNGSSIAAIKHAWGYSTKLLGNVQQDGSVRLFVQDRPLRGGSQQLITLGLAASTVQRKLSEMLRTLKLNENTI